MKAPDLASVYETFVRLPTRVDYSGYYEFLRTEIAPLLEELTTAGIVGWYSFLLHTHSQGVPTSSDDPSFYVHLRLEAPSVHSVDELIQRLPPTCLWTRSASNIDNPKWTHIPGTMSPSNYWRVLGEASEWVLRMIKAHTNDAPVPGRNVAQFVHYIHNQTNLHYELKFSTDQQGNTSTSR